jgi:hypothetical protein
MENGDSPLAPTTSPYLLSIFKDTNSTTLFRLHLLVRHVLNPIRIDLRIGHVDVCTKEEAAH